MKLESRYKQDNKECYCDLTRKLDDLCGFTIDGSRYKNYLLDTRDLWKNCLAIRVPGRTTGNVELDEDGIIINIDIAKELIGNGKMYPKNTNEEVKQYIGQNIQLN